VGFSAPCTRACSAKRTAATWPPVLPTISAGASQWCKTTPWVRAHSCSALEADSCSGPRRYTMCTSSAPSSLLCTAASTAVMPPPMTTTRRPTGRVARSVVWRSVAIKSTASCTPARSSPGTPRRWVEDRPIPKTVRRSPGAVHPVGPWSPASSSGAAQCRRSPTATSPRLAQNHRASCNWPGRTR